MLDISFERKIKDPFPEDNCVVSAFYDIFSQVLKCGYEFFLLK